MKTTLFESFPGTCPASVSLLRVSALELLWHPWVPPHDLAPINKKILSCEVPLLVFLICAMTVPFQSTPDPRKSISSSCFPPSSPHPGAVSLSCIPAWCRCRTFCSASCGQRSFGFWPAPFSHPRIAADLPFLSPLLSVVSSEHLALDLLP